MILITGGGTGGHLKIAKVIKKEFIKRGIKLIYIGSDNPHSADKEWFLKDTDFSKTFFLPSSGVVNKKGIQKIESLFNILKLSIKAKKIINENNIKAVFSVGGYSAAAASFGAILNNTPLFIHEQNAHIGTLNKILKPFSKRFFSTFLYNDPYPIEDKFIKNARIRKELKTIIFLGGSQGAKDINDIAIKIAPTLYKNNINIIHQTGKRDFQRVKKWYQNQNIKADVFDFDKNLINKIKKADFAISRAGASTLFELASNLLPTLFIPYPYAAGDHQYKNAKFLADKNMAIVKRKEELDDVLNIILHTNLEQISLNLKKLNNKDGAKFIVDRILDVLSI
jgi:UDP-N-acetylglucosamine--N-acetylmuramyl-(pentapeptide) pyrophosphoryl-undecaprenol N-acetylglucosamine transferase